MNQEIINPFGDLIVKDPRGQVATVSGLNAGALQTLISAVGRLKSGASSRRVCPAENAKLITSEQPGYGKSHLIGRLFSDLQGQATVVYVLPFQNSTTVFQSLMMAILREMHFPERTDSVVWNITQTSQLDILAHSVFAHLVADLLDGGFLQTDTREESTAFLRNDPIGTFQRGASHWAEWLETNWHGLEPLMEVALVRHGVVPDSAVAWLRIFRAYAFSPLDIALRRACLEWMSGQPGDAVETERLKLRPADIVRAEITPAEASSWCRARIVELCQFAVFFRPFVFCFDQTEVYGHQPALGRAFGMLIATVVSEAPNHLTIITANQEPWLERIVPFLEKADFERITKPPVTLEGLNREQALELATLRLNASGIPEERATGFLDSRWFEKLFPTGRNQMGARVFLQHCKERWERQPESPVPLADLFRQHQEKLKASPKRHGFEPDTLQWLVEHGARGQIGVTIEAITNDEYFNVRWKTPERICLFGFNAGSNWIQWRKIAAIATKKNKAHPFPPVKTVFFRAPGQPPIPGPDWSVREEIEEAKTNCLHIVSLSLEQLCELYAARELYADAEQGDIRYNTDQVIAFLGGHLSHWWARLSGPVEGASVVAEVAAV